MDSAARARGPAGTGGEDTGAVDKRRLQRRFRLAIIAVKLIPLQPGLQLLWFTVLQELIYPLWAVLPEARGHAGDGVAKLLPIRLIGHVRAVHAAADVGLLLIDAVAPLRPKLAGIVRFEPGQVDRKDVEWIVRIRKFEPLSGEVGGLFAAGHNGSRRGGGGRKTQVNFC